MKTKQLISLTSLIVIWLAFFSLNGLNREIQKEKEEQEKENPYEPAEAYFLQRTAPDYDGINALRAFEEAVSLVQKDIKQDKERGAWDNNWQVEGPGNIGGRFNTVAIHPTNPNIMYAGAATGGVWKTINGGTTWNPIFEANTYLSIGDIKIDKNNPNTIYVGTGDPQIGGYSFVGNGVFKSTDAGATWTNIGLQDAKIISRIILHPTNANTIYVAAMGLPFARTPDRGVYKTTDGGLSWNKVLYVSDQAGATDMVIDPQNPNILYASTWDRIRNMQESIVTGPNAKIYKTTDAGANWTPVMNGIVGTDLGRIGLAISQQNPNKLYTTVGSADLTLHGLYSTTNGGQNWTKLPANGLDSSQIYSNFGWYFAQIRIHPTNDNFFFVPGVGMMHTTDGGQNFIESDPNYELHADKHDVQFVSANTWIVATDGGLYKTTDNAQSWTDIEDMPVNQFYRVALNPHNPTYYYGGVQDNGSVGGNASMINNWERYWGGDGFQMRFDPNNVNLFYAESQNLGLVALDNGNYIDHTNGIDYNDRLPWDAAFTISTFDPNRQYCVTQKVYRVTTGAGGQWDSLSNDLTMGPGNFPRGHFLTWVEESPVNQNVIYTCASDGFVHISQNNGANWTNISAGLPDFYATSIHPSAINAGTAVVTFSGYRWNDNTPHIYKTTNYGATWTPIQGNLPQLGINDVVVLPSNEDVLFVANDGGIYGTVDGGASWQRVGGNMPIIPVYDIELDITNKKIVAGTYARSIQTYDYNAILISIGIQNPLAISNISVFPNPANLQISLKLPTNVNTNNCNVSIIDAQGKTVLTTCETKEIAIAHLSKGMYIVEAISGNQKFVGKWMKG